MVLRRLHSYLYVLGMILALTACAGTGNVEPEATATASSPPNLDLLPTRSLLSSDFANVCLGEAEPRAAAYVPESGEVQKMIVMEKSEDTGIYDRSYLIKFPREWTISDNDFASVSLVACFTRTNEEFQQTCEYDDTNSDEMYKLNVYDAAYEMKLYVVQSGELLTTEIFNEWQLDCPVVHMFSEPEEDYYPRPAEGSLQTKTFSFVEPDGN